MDSCSSFVPTYIEPPAELLQQIFPWVEEQAAALEVRVKALGRPAKDLALKQFLRLLVWLRRVLLQDAAVLFTLDPTCGIFQFPLFRSQAFRTFAAMTTSVIEKAENDARLALQNLPEHYARSMQGFVASARLAQDVANAEMAQQLGELRAQMARMEGLVGVMACTQSSHRKSCGMPFHVLVSANLSSIHHVGWQPPLPPPPTILVPAKVPPTDPMIGSASVTVHPLPHVPVSQTDLNSSTPFQVSAPSILATSGPADDEMRTQQWNALTARFREDWLWRHEWEWVSNDLLPFYSFQPVSSITEIWEEHTKGLNGYLAVHDLDEQWGPCWRRNRNGLRTENCCRKKIVTLVEQLLKKKNWNVALTLQFLREKYESHLTLTKPRAFCNYLQKSSGVGMAEVVAAAEHFP